jgi:hypothetical protein
MSYGYLGDTSTKIKQVKKNDGILTPSDVIDLTSQGHLGGSLELIQSQTLSGVTACNFTALKGAKYDVHVIHMINFSMDSSSSNEKFNLRFSNDGGSSYESANYSYALTYGETDGTFGEIRSTSDGAYENFSFSASTSSSCNAYLYFHNLHDSTRHSFVTSHSSNFSSSSVQSFIFGGGSYFAAETIDGISIYGEAGNAFSGTAKLYGVKKI